ncbi:25542_t:CDS:2, partial [Gigaspora margarita]
VDDNLITGKILLKILTNEFKHQIKFISSSSEALNLLSQDIYDLVFMDIDMPEKSGVKTCMQKAKQQQLHFSEEEKRKKKEKIKEENRRRLKEELEKKAILLDSETGIFDYVIESIYNTVKSDEAEEIANTIKIKVEDIENSIYTPKNRPKGRYQARVRDLYTKMTQSQLWDIVSKLGKVKKIINTWAIPINNKPLVRILLEKEEFANYKDKVKALNMRIRYFTKKLECKEDIEQKMQEVPNKESSNSTNNKKELTRSDTKADKRNGIAEKNNTET